MHNRNVFDVRLSQLRPHVVTRVIHPQTVQDIEMWLTPHDVSMLGDWCSTEHDDMVP